MKVSPYIFFAGNCKEAITFYKSVFGVSVNMYENPENPDLVYHAEFALGASTVMMSDGMEDMGKNGNIMLTINFEEGEKQKVAAAFEALSVGGVVTMPMDAVPWSKCYGMVTDKFGIQWIINQD